MASVGSITINDGSATPVAVTYTPEEISTSRTVWVDRRKTARSLQPSITLTFSPANGARPTFRPGLSVAYPVEGVVNGLPGPVGVMRFENGKVTIPDGTPLQERKHFHALVANGMNVAAIKAAFVDLEPAWSA